MKYIRKQNIVTADMNGETVMMDIESGQYYNIGEVGGRIWEILEKAMTLDEIVEKLTQEFEVSKEQCEKDIKPFLDDMVGKKLVFDLKS